MTPATAPHPAPPYRYLMRTCPRCHASYNDTVKFCPNDGSPLGEVAKQFAEHPRVCPTCGANYPGGRFCPHDGALLEAK